MHNRYKTLPKFAKAIDVYTQGSQTCSPEINQILGAFRLFHAKHTNTFKIIACQI